MSITMRVGKMKINTSPKWDRFILELAEQYTMNGNDSAEKILVQIGTIVNPIFNLEDGESIVFKKTDGKVSFKKG